MLGRIYAAEADAAGDTRDTGQLDSSVLLAQILILRNDYADAARLLTQAQAIEAQHGGIGAIARGISPRARATPRRRGSSSTGDRIRPAIRN